MFNELSGLDNVDEETDSGGVLLHKMLVDIWGILNIQTGGLNEGLVFYFLKYSEVVRGCGGRGCVNSRSNSRGRVEGVVNGVKVTIKLNESRGNVRGVHNEMVGETEGFDDEEFNESEEVRVLPNNVTSVHWV
jgi:hypothetical protein